MINLGPQTDDDFEAGLVYVVSKGYNITDITQTATGYTIRLEKIA